MFQFINNAGIPDQVFPTGADYSQPHLVIAQFPTDGLLGLARFQAPEMLGVPDLDIVILNIQINRLFCTTLHDYCIIACLFSFRPPKAPCFRLTKASCQGGLGPHHKAGQGRSRYSGQDPGGKNKFIIGTQGIDAPGQFL